MIFILNNDKPCGLRTKPALLTTTWKGASNPVACGWCWRGPLPCAVWMPLPAQRTATASHRRAGSRLRTVGHVRVSRDDGNIMTPTREFKIRSAVGVTCIFLTTESKKGQI